jgi:hypothetical protein
MLVHFTDIEGRETWVNPIHVKLVRTYQGLLGGKKGTEVWFSFNNTSEAVYLAQQPGEVAAVLDAAMPPVVVLGEGEEGSGGTRPPTPAGG